MRVIEKSEKILYIVRGVPGSGKSTYAKSLMAGKMSASHWETDMWFMDDKVYKFDPTKLADYHRECQRCVLRYAGRYRDNRCLEYLRPRVGG